MAQTTTSTHSVELQKYFSKELLSQQVQALRLAEFGKKAPLPTKAGQNSIRWFRYGNPSASSVATLTEGTVITGTRTLALTNVDATLVHYGQVVQITDELQAVEFFNSIEQATMTNAQDAALHADNIIRAELITGTTKRYSANGSTASFAGLQAATAAQGKFIALDALDGVTQLKINRAPTIGGGYVAVAPPQVTRDLMNDSAWLAAKQYSDVKDLYAGEVGSFHGLRFVEATNPWSEDETEGTFDDTYTASGTNSAGGLIYATFMLGGEAFGVPELNGESPYSPKVYITDGADKADPLNQLTNVGFKTWWAAKILNNSYFVVHRSKSAFA
jgi:N4-gp56 family major capsid protein